MYNTNPKILCLAKSANSLKYPKIRIVKSNVNLTEAYIEVYNTNVANNHYLTAYVTGFTCGNGSMSSVNFTPGEIPDGYTAYEYDIANSGVVSYTPVPATLTSSGTVGDIAYDTNYLYMCTAANTWKKTAWGADVYSTTETVIGTYMGKPLYRKVIDCGALPNNSTKAILHNIANINIITNMSGTGWDSAGTTIPLPTASLTSPVIIYSDKSKIYITTITDRSTFTTSNVTLEYTKTTDA